MNSLQSVEAIAVSRDSRHFSTLGISTSRRKRQRGGRGYREVAVLIVPTQALFDICQEQNLDVEYNYLGTNLRGLYICHPRLYRPLIVLHDSLITDERLLRCVLAEEIGHHYTGAGNYMIGYHKSTRVWLDKIEYLAMKWAVNYLVPEDKFILRLGRYTLEELADMFYVTIDFIKWQANRLHEVLQEKWKRDPREWNF